MRKIDLDAERAYENGKVVRGLGPRSAQSKFYWATGPSIDAHMSRAIREIKGKTILEIGCSVGEEATEYVRHAEKYVGVDISDKAIEAAAALGLPNAEFLCIDGHTIPKPSGTFDCVVVNSLLHHLDLEVAFVEISRLLKNGGVLIFREPLGTNPIFNLYRSATPEARTEDERPFTFQDLSLMARFFEMKDVQYFGFTCLASAFFGSKSLRRFLTATDRLLSASPMKYFYWQFSGVAKKLG
jgi:SAM-dependent methyltransferase